MVKRALELLDHLRDFPFACLPFLTTGRHG